MTRVRSAGAISAPHRRRIALALACAGLVGLMGGCSASSSRPTQVPTTSQIRAVLTSHAAAVRTRDAPAFAAALADGSASAAFRKRAQSQFGSLAGVPLAGWSYDDPVRTDDRSAERAATRRYGAPAVIMRISFGYSLSGFDAAPSRHDLWWTFVVQRGRVRVAGDDDLASAGGAGWRGPWDFGPRQVVHEQRSLVLAPTTVPRSELTVVAGVVDDAIPGVTSVWGGRWGQRVVVIIPGFGAELAADAGFTAVSKDTAALAVGDAGDDTAAANGGVVTGQRLIVNPDEFAHLSATGRRIVIRHEITHLAAAATTSPATPRWIVEGFADYVGNLGSGQSTAQAAAELRQQVRTRGVPARLPADSDFDSGGAAAAAAYQQAWLACRMIAERAGQAGLVRFYRLAAATAVTGDPTTQALRSVLHTTPDRFAAQWRTYVAAQFRDPATR